MELNVDLYFFKQWVPNPADYGWFESRKLSIAPEGAVLVFFRDALNTPEYHEWARRLVVAGMKPFPQSWKFTDDDATNQRYIGYYYRQAWSFYTPEECRRAEYSQFFFAADMQGGCADAPPGEEFIDIDNVANEVEEDTARAFRTGRLRFFGLSYNYLAVSDEGKRLLEASGLTGFQITRPLKVTGDDADRVKGRYWHLDLTSTLPLSSKIRWVAADGSVLVRSKCQ